VLKKYLSISTHVAEISKPLESLGITGFFFARIYSDGSFINLASEPDWFEYYYTQLFQGRYRTKDISDQLYSHDDVSLWTLNPNNQVWQDGMNHFGCGNGVSLYEENEQARDITGFYSTPDNHGINHFYINHVDELKQFKRCFVSKADALIQEVNNYKCQLPQSISQDRSSFQSKQYVRQQLGLLESTFVSLDWNTIFQLSMVQLDALLVRQRYPIQLDTGKFTLSRMEIKTLVQLLKGQHSGEIAAALGLKQNTVESYLSNIKNKLGVNLKSELLQTVINNQLLQQIC